MGLFDHLFKSKSPPSEESSSEAAARSIPPDRADPSVFLHPKSFVPRGATPLTPPGKSGAVSGVRKLGAPPAPPAADEIVLVLGDVLSRIPTPYLKSGAHDPKRELRFSINDLSSDIARGRAAVPLSRIAQLLPDIFVKEISPDEDTEVRLPLQKLVEQIGLLRSRPSGLSSERAPRPANAPPVVETLHPEPDSEIRLEPSGEAAQTLQPARETLRFQHAPAESVIELKPVEDAVAPTPKDAEPSPVDTPPNEEPAPDASSAPEVPAPVSPDAKAPEIAAPEETPAETAPVPDEVDAVAMPRSMEAAKEAVPSSPAPEPAAPAPSPVAESAPLPEAVSETATVETPDADIGEPFLPISQSAPPAAPVKTSGAEPITPAASVAETGFAETNVPSAIPPEVVENESGGERIHLSLAAILRECPAEIIVSDLPEVPDNVRITLPFAPIDRQLGMGHVEISAVRFVAALPFSYQKYFTPRIGVKVPIPLEEVFQNLPDPVAAARAAANPPMQFLAPAEGAAASAPLEEKRPAVADLEAGAAAFDQEKLEPVNETKETSVVEPVASESSPLETAPATVPALDLSAFHVYVPPPPVIIPGETEPPEVIAIAPLQPAENASSLVPTTSSAESDSPRNEFIPADLPVGDALGAAISEPAEPPVGDLASASQLITPLCPDLDAPADSRPDIQVDDEQVAVPWKDEKVETVPVSKDESAAAPAVEGNSAAVFAEANQMIPAPQWARPFIILPPPIFGFPPTPMTPVDEVKNLQPNDTQAIAPEVTAEEENIFVRPSEVEAVSLDRETHSEDKPNESLPAEILLNGETVAETQPASSPTIISIDFSEALVPPDESALTNAAPLIEISEVPPQSPTQAIETPDESEPVAAEPEANELEGKFAEDSAPERISIPSVGVTPVVVRGDEPAADSGPLPADVPVEAPTNSIVFMVEGQFADRPLKVVPDWEPVAEPKTVPDEPPSVKSEPTPAGPSDEERAPLLALPRFIPNSHSSDTLPPPALPLRRFDQDALQALFMTDEVLDLSRISRLAAQLPGVHACVIATRDQACTGGRLPEGFDLAALLGLAPRVGEAAGRMPIGSLKHFTLYGEQYSVSFFERNGLSLCAVHRPRSFVPGVREKLVAIADELSKS